MSGSDSVAGQPARWARKLQPGQRAELHFLDVASGESRLLLSTAERLIEAPNWHPGGRWIVVNADGVLFRIDAEGPGRLEEIPGEGLPELNNDHLVSPDGRWHFVSANDGHVYRFPWAGGASERVTSVKAPERQFRHFLHGISGDGRLLAYVGTEEQDGDPWAIRALWLLDLESGEDRRLGNGYSPADGPEFSRDGKSLYFNSEVASSRAGHAQLFRYDFESGEAEQLTQDERVNWFPHPSPDGRRIAYLSYAPGTTGHPPDQSVLLRMIDLPGGEMRDMARFTGGQGTINVSSWAPDSRRLAYIRYVTASA